MSTMCSGTQSRTTPAVELSAAPWAVLVGDVGALSIELRLRTDRSRENGLANGQVRRKADLGEANCVIAELVERDYDLVTARHEGTEVASETSNPLPCDLHVRTVATVQRIVHARILEPRVRAKHPHLRNAGTRALAGKFRGRGR